MKKLYLIRHGHSLHNELFLKMGVKAFRIPEVKDSPLTDKGHHQSKSLGETIGEKHIDLVLVSPLMRTLETAENIFGDKNIPIRCMECLREYPLGLDTCNIRSSVKFLMGKFPEIDFTELVSDTDIYWKPGGETFDELDERISEFVEYVKKLPHKKIAVISHNSWIGRLKDNHISQLENGEEELKHCYPYEYILSD